jgi:hypothetical protein
MLLVGMLMDCLASNLLIMLFMNDGWGHANLNTSCLIIYFVSRLCRKLPPFDGMTKKEEEKFH